MSLTSASFNAKLPAPSVDFAPFSYQGDTYQTWYTVYGNLGTAATPLVVLHGGPGFTHEYMLAMADISAHSIPVILYDQIGNGRSSHIHDKPDTFWTIDLFIDELENLLKHLKIERKFDLYGHSWGGMMASEFSVRRQPAGLRHLVLANSLTAMALWNRSFSERLAAMPKDVQEKIAAGPSNLAPFLEGMLALYAEYGCRTKPIRPELLDTLSWVYGKEGKEGDRTAGKGM
jgi:proline-specific peptidase